MQLLINPLVDSTISTYHNAVPGKNAGTVGKNANP